MYINDFPDVDVLTEIFADDTILFLFVARKRFEYLKACITEGMKRLFKYLIENLLRIQPYKTNLIVICSQGITTRKDIFFFVE